MLKNLKKINYEKNKRNNFLFKKVTSTLMNIDFFIENKIKLVQASTNYEIENHGFIIRKPFKDFSFDELF